MGVGQRKKIQIVEKAEQQGVDGIEPIYNLVKQLWAEVSDVSIGNNFNGQQSAVIREYEFLIDYDSTLSLDYEKIIEYTNYQFLIKSIERGDRLPASNKYGYRFIENQEGAYIRITAESESYG